MVRRLLLLASASSWWTPRSTLAITPLLPDLRRDFALTKGQAGVLAAAYPAGTFAGALPGGWLAARLGVRPDGADRPRRDVLASLGFAFGESIVVLDVARFVQGARRRRLVGRRDWLADPARRRAERRGELIGSAMGAAIAGALLGPVLGALAPRSAPEAVFCSGRRRSASG